MTSENRKCENNRCGILINPKPADVRRGWGRFCSKSCKATVQKYGRGTKPGNFQKRPEPLGSGEFHLGGEALGVEVAG